MVKAEHIRIRKMWLLSKVHFAIPIAYVEASEKISQRRKSSLLTFRIHLRFIDLRFKSTCRSLLLESCMLRHFTAVLCNNVYGLDRYYTATCVPCIELPKLRLFSNLLLGAWIFWWVKSFAFWAIFSFQRQNYWTTLRDETCANINCKTLFFRKPLPLISRENWAMKFCNQQDTLSNMLFISLLITFF